MRARQLIQEIVPPIIFRAAEGPWRRIRGLKPYVFEGCYPSFAALPEKLNSYEDDDYVQTVAIAFRNNLAEINLAPVDTNDGPLLSLAVADLSGEVTVIDFGGGPARGLFDMAKRLSDISHVRYVLIDPPATCKALRAIDASILKKRVRSFEIESDIPATVEGTAIANLAIVIQHIEDWRGTLGRIAALRPRTIITSVVPNSERPTYLRQLFPMPDKRMAEWVFNRLEFVGMLQHLGYKLVYGADHKITYPHRNAPGPSVYSSFVFKAR
jgi:putative methyltransferase (TIGR04325 family)